jgi:hypothetical protein
LFAFAQETPIVALMRVLGALYLVIAPVIAIPALFLFRYATAAKRYREVQGPIYLEEALREHARFWMYAGIVTVVGVIIEVSFLAVLIFGVLA